MVREDMIFAERMKTLRKKHGYTQAELAALIGMDQSELSKLERGLRQGTFRIALSAAQLFDTSVDYLLGLTDYPHPYPRSKKPD